MKEKLVRTVYEKIFRHFYFTLAVVISSFTRFLPVFATLRGRGRVSAPCGLSWQWGGGGKSQIRRRRKKTVDLFKYIPFSNPAVVCVDDGGKEERFWPHPRPPPTQPRQWRAGEIFVRSLIILSLIFFVWTRLNKNDKSHISYHFAFSKKWLLWTSFYQTLFLVDTQASEFWGLRFRFLYFFFSQ